jgi:putative endonuclease
MIKTIGTRNYYVYILTNQTKNVLYVGVSNDLEQRLFSHQNPEVNSKSFTAKYRCFYLIYYERFQNVEDAIRREKELKGWRRDKKDKLIISFNQEWKFLNNEFE